MINQTFMVTRKQNMPLPVSNIQDLGDTSIREISITDAEAWDAVIKGFEHYEPFYLHGYVKAFAEHSNGEPVLLVYEEDGVKAANVVVRRDIYDIEGFAEHLPPKTYYDLSTPYGYGGFICDTGITEKIQQEYNRYCLQQGYICEFVRFNLFSDYVHRYDGTTRSNMLNIVCDLSGSWDDVFARYQGKTRQKVRKVQKNGWTVRVGNACEDIESFLPIYYDTMDRNQAQNMYYFKHDFFATLKNLGDKVQYFFAEKDGQVGAVNVLIAGAENTYCFLSSTAREFLNESPNYLLMSEMIAWSHAQGFKNFVIGGGYGSNDELLRFKKGFAPEGTYDFDIGSKIFNQEVYDALVEIRKEAKPDFDTESAYFPLYRA